MRPRLAIRRLALCGLLSGLALVSRPAAAPQPVQATQATASRAPKLAVIVVVDQMRADYVDRFQAEWTGGLKRLVTTGAWFTHAAYPYLTTLTCVGHATIATGAFPASHGIIQNAWFDRPRNRLMTCTADPDAHDIGYGGTVAGGDSAYRLQLPTFADTMRSARSAHVVSLSLKDRAAIMLAGHGGDAVTWLSNSLDGWVTSTAYAKGPNPAVKTFIDANPIDADYGKTWTRLLPAARYREADDGRGEAPPGGWSATFPHELTGAKGTPDLQFHTEWERSPFADTYLERFAAALVDTLRLGRHEGTDVLAVSFSSPDLVGHAFGPDSQEIHDMYARLDLDIGALLDRLDALVGRDAYIVALSADHGVTPLPEQLKARGKDGGRLDGVQLAALVETRAAAILGRGKFVSRVNGNDVYFEPGMYERLQQSPEAMQAVIGALLGSPGIARVYRGEELRGAGNAADPLLRAAALSDFPGRSGDIILVPKPGWMFIAGGTTHGTASADDQHVPVVFMGAGIKAGRYAEPVTPADVAPTLAAVCGITMPGAQGHALRSALR